MKIIEGDSIALIGHNGAGKSTLLRIISKLTTVSSGIVKYNESVKIRYIPEHFPKLNISAREYIKYMGKIEGLTDEIIEKLSKSYFKRFFMENMVDTELKNMSKGTLQKVGVIQALLVKPDILLLDEPLSGQDIDSQNKFIKLMNQLNSENTTMIMSCHEKFLINRMSNTIYQIDKGKITQLQKKEGPVSEYDILIFDKIPIDIDVNKLKDEHVISISYIGADRHKCKVVVDDKNSNIVIKDFLERGSALK